jgi:hypothetical protein
MPAISRHSTVKTAANMYSQPERCQRQNASIAASERGIGAVLRPSTCGYARASPLEIRQQARFRRLLGLDLPRALISAEHKRMVHRVYKQAD